MWCNGSAVDRRGYFPDDHQRTGVGGKTEAPVTPQVTPQVETLILGYWGEMGRDELQKDLGLKARKNLRLVYLQPAIDNGFVEMIIPNKPKSRLQKYRLTEAGQEMAERLKKL